MNGTGINPALFAMMLRRALGSVVPPPLGMYGHMLAGGGQPVRNLDPRLAAAIDKLTFMGPDPEGDPEQLDSYGAFIKGDYKNPENIDMGVHLGGMYNDPALMVQRSLGRFRATPVGRDSVRIRDNYDFNHDAAYENPSSPLDRINPMTSLPYILLGNAIGKSYPIDATIFAPNTNRQVRQNMEEVNLYKRLK